MLEDKTNNSLIKVVVDLIARDESRFCTPGHKGKNIGILGSVQPLDVTETEDTDSLYEATGVLYELEEKLSRLYGDTTLISPGGSTLSIQAMLAATVSAEARILVGRGCHTAAVNAMALLNITPVWMNPRVNSTTGLAYPLTPEQVEIYLRRFPTVNGVYLTSPDYYGNHSDIESISIVCEKYRVPLLVDAAHGAHYRFLKNDLHPTALGADACCTSLHKTLPSLTGASLLHLGENYSRREGKKWMSLFASTSPSYLIMLSIDELRGELEKNLPEKIQKLQDDVFHYLDRAKAKGFQILEKNTDPCRITLGFGRLGYSKKEFEEILVDCKIIPEYMDDYYSVLIPSVYHDEGDWNRLEQLLEKSPLKKITPVIKEVIEEQEQVLSLRKAVFSPNKTVPTLEGTGQVAANMVTPCPPGVPQIMPGERISGDMAKKLLALGITQINVI